MSLEAFLLGILSSFGVERVYGKKHEILELSKTNRAVRYMIILVAVPFTIIVLAILYNMIRKNPELLTWSNPQKKLTDYFE